MTSQYCEHLSHLVPFYDTFVFPIYGILHDGRKLNQLALNCLTKLSDLGLSTVIFSNVPRRRAQVMQELMHMGISPSLYQHVITAGEQTWLALKHGHDPFHGSLGPNCYCIGPARAFDFFEGLPFYRVPTIEQADFILVLGLDEWHNDLTYYFSILDQAYEKRLPLVCSSADHMVNYDHKVVPKAGQIARYYEEKGGSVYYHGKPYHALYDTLIDELSPLNCEKILIIGDSLATDIKGANHYGLDNLLVTNTTTLQELNLITDRHYSNSELMLKIIETNHIPRYVMRTLQW